MIETPSSARRRSTRGTSAWRCPTTPRSCTATCTPSTRPPRPGRRRPRRPGSPPWRATRGLPLGGPPCGDRRIAPRPIPRSRAGVRRRPRRRACAGPAYCGREHHGPVRMILDFYSERTGGGSQPDALCDRPIMRIDARSGPQMIVQRGFLGQWPGRYGRRSTTRNPTRRSRQTRGVSRPRPGRLRLSAAHMPPITRGLRSLGHPLRSAPSRPTFAEADA